MTKKEKLAEIAQSRELTDAQKKYVVEQAALAGVEFNPRRTRCQDCYKDMAMELWRRLAEKDALKDKTRLYILRPGIDVLFKGQRVTAALNDEDFVALVAKGFPTTYFLKMPSNESNE